MGDHSIPKVQTWRLERDSNSRPSGRKELTPPRPTTIPSNHWDDILSSRLPVEFGVRKSLNKMSFHCGEHCQSDVGCNLLIRAKQLVAIQLLSSLDIAR